jgi:hypothetical protein
MLRSSTIDAQRREGGKFRKEQLVNKNTITPKNRGPS